MGKLDAFSFDVGRSMFYVHLLKHPYVAELGRHVFLLDQPGASKYLL
jgi:hypothetical protein